MKTIPALIKNQYTTLSRDSFMMFIFSLPAITALLFRIVIPIAEKQLLHLFDLREYDSLITLFALLMSPMMSGIVVGFNLLDERDEDILSFMSITPLKKQGYMLFKIFVPMFLVIIQSAVILMILPTPKLNYLRIALLIVILCLQTPLYSLLIASIAGNKVEGLAAGKFTGIGLAGLFISYFITSPWKYVAAIFPPFWIAECYHAPASNFWLLYTISILLHLLYLYFGVKLFVRKTG